MEGDTLLLLTNTSENAVDFTLPDMKAGENTWTVMVDTARDDLPTITERTVNVDAHALMLLRFSSDRRLTPHGGSRRASGEVEKHTP